MGQKISASGPVRPRKGPAPSRTYRFEYGGTWWPEEPCYEVHEITVHEGDTCPECGFGVMRVSRNNKLYCSDICWEK